jgi:hypothetical protein
MPQPQSDKPFEVKRIRQRVSQMDDLQSLLVSLERFIQLTLRT